jgi:transcriptional regulator with XRE-family HTH domain
MSSEPPTAKAWGPHLAEALRSIRTARGLSAAQLADLMGMDRRNYANFEAGKGRLNLERVLAFAQATDSDAWAILAGVVMGAPQLAWEAADNKLLVAFFILLGEFDHEFGAAIRTLDTAEIVTAFREAFRSLETTLTDKRSRLGTDWLQEGAARIGLGGVAQRRDDESS